MQLRVRSNWMEAQKHANVMAPATSFQVIQTSDGCSVVFSLGDDKILYATRELQQSHTGWSRIDLSSSLSSTFSNAAVEAKMFCVSQNPLTSTVDLAIIVTSGGSDHLAFSLNNPNTDEAWGKGVTWTRIDFDASGVTKPTNMNVSDLFFVTWPAVSGTPATRGCFVDIPRLHANGLNLIERYYILSGQSSQSPSWNAWNLDVDISASTVQSCIGQRSKDHLPGIYTYGTIDNQVQLIYATEYNWYSGPDGAPPSIVRLMAPTGATAIASALNANGHSNLFVSGTSGLHVFVPSVQDTRDSALNVISGKQFANSVQLSAATVGKITSVWAVDTNRTLYYSTCPAGQESDRNAWSVPVPLLDHVQNFAFYTGAKDDSHTLFAHVTGDTLVQMTQDSVTTAWEKRFVMLPTTDVTKMIPFNAYSTRIELLNKDSIPTPNKKVSLKATSPIGVYANNDYYLLQPTVAALIPTDESGAVNIVQQSNSLVAVCYEASYTSDVVDEGTITTIVNPASNVLDILSQTANIGTVYVPLSNGTTRKLVPEGTSEEDITAASTTLLKLGQIGTSKDMPADGKPILDSPVKRRIFQDSIKHVNPLFTLHVNPLPGRKLKLVQGYENWVAQADKTPGSFLNPGSFFRMLAHYAETGVESLTFGLANGIHYVVSRIGNVTYSTLLDSYSAVSRCADWVLDKLKIAKDWVMGWLGYIFTWPDFVRTHSVVKNIIMCFIDKIKTDITGIETTVTGVFDSMEAQIKKATGIKSQGDTMGTYSSSGARSKIALANSEPQSHWGSQTFKAGLTSSDNKWTPKEPSDDMRKMLDTLKALAKSEEASLKGVLQDAITSIVDVWDTLTWPELLHRVLGLFAVAFFETAKNVVVALFEILKIMIEMTQDLIEAKLDIPIISHFYEKWVGGPLTYLDAVCFVAAIPATIAYKAMIGQVPFPDTPLTKQLTQAEDWSSVVSIMKGSASPKSQKRLLQANGHVAMNGHVNGEMANHFKANSLGLDLDVLSASDNSALADSDVFFTVNLTFMCFGCTTNIMNMVVTGFRCTKSTAQNADDSVWPKAGQLLTTLDTLTWLPGAVSDAITVLPLVGIGAEPRVADDYFAVISVVAGWKVTIPAMTHLISKIPGGGEKAASAWDDKYNSYISSVAYLVYLTMSSLNLALNGKKTSDYLLGAGSVTTRLGMPLMTLAIGIPDPDTKLALATAGSVSAACGVVAEGVGIVYYKNRK